MPFRLFWATLYIWKDFFQTVNLLRHTVECIFRPSTRCPSLIIMEVANVPVSFVYIKSVGNSSNGVKTIIYIKYVLFHYLLTPFLLMLCNGLLKCSSFTYKKNLGKDIHFTIPLILWLVVILWKTCCFDNNYNACLSREKKMWWWHCISCDARDQLFNSSHPCGYVWLSDYV